MKRRVLWETTPEARLAAAASNLVIDMSARLKHPPDFADYRDALQPYIAREILLARVAEAKICGRLDRVADLEYQIARIVLQP